MFLKFFHKKKTFCQTFNVIPSTLIFGGIINSPYLQSTPSNSNPLWLEPPPNSKQFSFPFRTFPRLLFLYNFTLDDSNFFLFPLKVRVIGSPLYFVFFRLNPTVLLFTWTQYFRSVPFFSEVKFGNFCRIQFIINHYWLLTINGQKHELMFGEVNLMNHHDQRPTVWQFE